MTSDWIGLKPFLDRLGHKAFFDAADKTSKDPRVALNNPLEQYKVAFDANPEGNVWWGVDLLALSVFAKRHCIPTKIDIEPRA